MKSILIIILAILMGSMQLYAQKSKADANYKLYKFDEAIPLYEKYLKGTPNDYEALKSLSDCYKLTNNISKESEAYKTIVSLKESTADDLFELVQVLRTQQNIAEAKTYASKYKNAAPGEKADNLMRSLDMYEALMENKNDYVITNRTSSYTTSIFGAIKYKSQILVTAENVNAKTSNWTGRGYTDLFTTDDAFEHLTPFAKEVMIKLDDGFPTFTDNGNTMYYTSIHDDFTKEGNTNTQKLKIAVATFDGSTWKKGTEFPYNSTQYKTAHPAISTDGTLLVFASDMPGGKGGIDLYLCTRQGTGWSQPQNIVALNTAENELFPIFNSNGDLIFSSDGLPGLGGLDIFVTKRNNNTFDQPVNLKAPFNSSFDDFYLYSDNDLSSGYLSSNRFNDPQIDHVLSFEKVTKRVTPVANTGLVVKVLDKFTHTPLPYVSVTIKDKNGQVFHKGLSDPNGQITLDEFPRGDYVIQGMLNDVATTIAKVNDADFNSNKVITREVLHNDPRFTLAGVAINTKTNAPLPEVVITCLNTIAGITKKTTTGDDGKFLFQLEQNSDFEVQGSKKGWLSSEVATKTTKGLDRSQQLYVNLELRIEQPVNSGTITLKKIHYDYNKCEIRPDASIELDRLVKLLNDYPDMSIELSSHTDSRGADDYNLKLSQGRADAAVAYLIKQGINKNRMIAKGYGETKLLNDCKNGVTCTDMQHEENRRTEFTILSCASCLH